MSINQLSDDGAVIGYKPNLQYTKDSNTKSVTEDSSVTDYSGNTKYSNTVVNFSDNLPSTSLSTINFVQNNMKELIDELSKAFENNNWNEYNEISFLLNAIDNNNKEYINEFVNYHTNSITGSSIPELIKIIYDTKERLTVLDNTLKYIYYGNSNLSLEECEEIDNSYLSQIKTYETNKEINKINYMTLSYDAMLNRSVNLYSFSANRCAINIADIIASKTKYNSNDSSIYLIEKFFNDSITNFNNRYVTYEQQQNIEIMQKTLYNYYIKRQEIIDLYQLYENNIENVFIGNKLSSYNNDLNDAIININKTFMGNKYYLSELTEIEKEKYLLRNIYSISNYKSEE